MPADERAADMIFEDWTRPVRYVIATRRDYLEVYKGRDGWRWRHRAGNHRILGQGESYSRRRDAVRGAVRAVPHVVVKVR